MYFFTFSCDVCVDCHDHGSEDARIDNGWILFSMAVGAVCCTMEKWHCRNVFLLLQEAAYH